MPDMKGHFGTWSAQDALRLRKTVRDMCFRTGMQWLSSHCAHSPASPAVIPANSAAISHDDADNGQTAVCTRARMRVDFHPCHVAHRTVSCHLLTGARPPYLTRLVGVQQGQNAAGPPGCGDNWQAQHVQQRDVSEIVVAPRHCA